MLTQSFYLFAAKVIGYGIRILLPVFLVRVLTKAEYGAYNQFFLLEIMLKTVFQMGANQSLFFFIPRDMKNGGAYYINSMLLNAALLTIAFGLVGGFRGQISDFLGMPVLKDMFWLLAAHSFLMMLNVTTETYLVARKQFAQSAVFDAGRQVFATIATLIAAYMTRDLRIIILALVLSRAISFVVIILYVHFRQHGFRSERYFFGVGKQIRYGIVVGLAGTLWTVLMRMNELAVSKFFDIETYAVYAAGCKQIPVLQFFSQSIAAVALVRFAQLEKENDWDGIRRFWDKILGSLYGVGVPVTVFFIVVAQPLVTLMFTKEYSDAIIIFQINSIAMLFHLLNPTLVLRAMDRNDISVKVHASMVLLMPAMLYLGMKLFGLVGVISAHAFVLILGRVVNHTVLNRLSPVYLPYIPPRKAVWEFYRDSYIKLRSKATRVLRRRSGS